VHEEEAYGRLMDKHRAFFDAILEHELYNEYVELEFSVQKKE
jgi:hypothetical protein